MLYPVVAGIADDDILDDHMFQSLKEMRAEFKRLAHSADAWQSTFCSEKFLAALYPKLPVSTKDERMLVSDARRLSDTSAQAVDAFAELNADVDEHDVDYNEALCSGAWRRSVDFL